MIRILNNIYSNEECKRLIEISKTYGVIEPVKNKGENKNTYALSIDPIVYSGLLDRFFALAERTNLQFFGFAVHQMQFGHINYNRYEIGSYYGWHMDINYGNDLASDIKFTGIINVSTESYLGGNFEITANEEGNKRLNEEFTPGSILFFISPLSHRVTPVTEGVRESLSFWFQGPKWR